MLGISRMSMPADHPLRNLLAALTEKSFYEHIGWPDIHVVRYISDLLVEFTETRNVYKIKDATGKRLKEVAEMLLEAEQMTLHGTWEREREVHRHIGDYTLFMMGIFPEYLKRFKVSGIISHPDALLDYAKVGKRSYGIASELVGSRLREVAPLFKKLSEHFELCVMGLGYVRQDLDRLRIPDYQKNKRILLN